MAGDFDYAPVGSGYPLHRQPDPRIEALVHAALGPDGPVVNVGAGAGSYEPPDRPVVAVEPSGAMRAARRPGAAPALCARAEALPFADGTFGAAMATVTVHQWPDQEAGLRELRRVSRGPVVVLTFDGAALDRLWLAEYAPEVMAAEARRYPAIDDVVTILGRATVEPVPVPLDCRDGFTEAYYGRPELFLDPAVRRAQSAWSFVAPDVVDAGMARLAADLASGAWDARHGALRRQAEFVGALRLIRSVPG